LAEGFVRYRRESLGVSHEDERFKRVIYQGCLTLLYRLLFLLNAESRQLLPVDNPDYRARSLRALMERIWEEYEQPRDPSHDFEYWTHLERLFRMMDEGAPTFNLPKYNGGLFKRPNPGTPLEKLQEEEIGPWFLETHKLSDPYLRDVIEQLTFDPEASPGKRAFIDYSSLGVRHLGEIYEGLLEFKIEIAEDEPVCAVGPTSKPVWKKQSEVEPGETVHVTKEIGQPYITNDKGERKATGSYYTPHYIVEYIVEHSIGPQLNRFEQEKEWSDQILSSDATLQTLYEEIMGETVSAEDERERLDALWKACRTDEERRDFLLRHLDPEWGHHQFDPATRALELKVLDPAMGSGHFLVHAVDVIADRVADFLDKYPDSPVADQLEQLRQSVLQNVQEQGVEIDETKLNDVNLIKRMVMKRCIYGVDLNPMAVELAKLSLWLDSFTVGAPLSFLDHHLKCGNSLIGATDVSEYLAPGSEREKQFLRAVGNLLLVADITDATISEVEQSQELYKAAQQSLDPVKLQINVVVARYFINLNSLEISHAAKYAYGEESGPKDRFAEERFKDYQRAQEIARKKRFFHWQLEFPEVWYTKQGKRHNPGFDAVIGNPPYVRQEQITANKDYFGVAFAVYRSTADLYVYFYEIAHRLLRPGGAFGMITSNKFMRAAYGKPLRRFLAQGIYMRQIIDFGDLPVFPDASAYPCVVITSKEEREGRPTAYLRVPSLEFGSLEQFVRKNAMPLPAEAFQDEHWQLASAVEHRILRKMEEVSVPLERWLGDVEIRRGVLTGFNEAFFIDEEMRERLIEQDPKSAEIIKPLVVGDDIKRYEIEFKGRYLIFTRRGVQIENYPAIKAHLEQYKKELIPRPDDWDEEKQGEWPGRKPGNYQWYEIQDTIGYYKEFEKPKIVYQEIAKHQAFAFDRDKLFCNNKCFIIPTNNLFLLALLNSRITWVYLTSKVSKLHGDTFALQSIYVENLPIRYIFFTTPEGERQAQVAVLQRLYQEEDFLKLLEAVEAFLPKDENGEFVVFTRSIPTKQAIEKGWLTEEQAEKWALESNDLSGYDEQGRPLERSDVVHDLLAYLAERMIEMHKQKRQIIERFWTDLEGVTDPQIFKKLRKGKQERTLARSEACRPFVDPESHSTKSLEASLEWNEAAFREFARALAGRIGNLSDLVEVYRRYAPDFKELMEKIETTDRLIDQIVYRLYGLTEEEIAVVEAHEEIEEQLESVQG